jgi:hypothetical protein
LNQYVTRKKIVYGFYRKEEREGETHRSEEEQEAGGMATMESLIGLVNRIQRACTVLGTYGGDESALPTLWEALPSVVVVGGQVLSLSLSHTHTRKLSLSLSLCMCMNLFMYVFGVEILRKNKRQIFLCMSLGLKFGEKISAKRTRFFFLYISVD